MLLEFSRACTSPEDLFNMKIPILQARTEPQVLTGNTTAGTTMCTTGV